MAEINFQNLPFVEVKKKYKIWQGWDDICTQLLINLENTNGKLKVIAVEYYPGVIDEEVSVALKSRLNPTLFFHAKDLYHADAEIRDMVQPDVTDDRVFGHISNLSINNYLNVKKVAVARQQIASLKSGTVLIVGTGAASILPDVDILVYADMARWEIQLRMRQQLVDNLGINNRNTSDISETYKHAYFVDWRVCDKLKKELMPRWDYVLDTNHAGHPKLVPAAAIFEGLKECLTRPFSIVPFFDPGPWGGQWMKEHCNLDKSAPNYAWCFNCVPEENSLLLKINDVMIEIPSINLVFFNPEHLLGPDVYQEFGTEFPIRFDFLDTIGGGNLSLQVHPLKEYIREKFGMAYTQDESYYMMDAKPGAVVYLGLKEDIAPQAMIRDLEVAEQGGQYFDADKYVEIWPAKKHDHFLIPAGTIHCSGKDGMVLEISATPYIFTFKLWDWGRVGMDGKPRPINIEHGKQNIQWERSTSWVSKHLVNNVKEVAEGEGWTEERTGLHESQFIETRRHWFTKKVLHHTGNGVNVLCLVEGDQIIVESPTDAFEPFMVNYAETFIVPAAVGEYWVRPVENNTMVQHATMKAFVRPVTVSLI